MTLEFFNSDVFTFIIVPIFIFFARVLDVSIGTVKLIFINRGFKRLAPLLGFIEVFIWIIAIRQIFLNLTNWLTYFAYAGGFATGTYVGIILEEKISIGKVLVRIITKRDVTELIENLKKTKHALTTIEGNGPVGTVKIVFTVINRRDIPEVIDTIKRFNPKAFYTIEDVRFASEENGMPETKKRYPRLFGFFRKGK